MGSISSRLLMTCMALGTLLALAVLTPLSAQASSVTIQDQAGVLDAGRVRGDATKFPDPLLIYTTNNFTGDQNSLDDHTHQLINNPQLVVIGIDTAQHHLAIESGVSVKLSNVQAASAVSAFKDNFNNGDYTGATISAVASIQSSLIGGAGPFITPAGIMVAIGLGIALIAIVVFAFLRRRSGGGGGFPGGGGRRWGWGNRYYGGYYPVTPPYTGQSGNYGGGAGGSFGGGAGGSF